MSLTRRAFLCSASQAVAGGALSTALNGCSKAPDAKSESAKINSLRATRKPIRPPDGMVLFIAGQGADQLGGGETKGLGDGYLDHMRERPGGFSLYCSVHSPPYLDPVVDLPALKDSVLHLSVGWVDDFDLSTKKNNQLITTGEFDNNIDQLAKWCAAHPRPILMRIGYEFDRGVPIPDYHYDAAYFAAGFRRIVDRLRAAKADNVSSVLASTNAPSLSPALTTASFNRFYPGDDYVDWLGCSMWHPKDVDHVILREARKRNKPVLLAETTPVKYNIGKGAYYPNYLGLSEKVPAQTIWDGWHQPMLNFIEANSDVVAGWHYIAADWSADALWRLAPIFTNCDARPWAMPEFLEIWARYMNRAPYLQASPNLFSELGYS